MAEKVFTINEVAGMLRLNERTVRRWIAAGKLRAFPIPGRGRGGQEWRVPASAIDEVTGRGMELGNDSN